MSDDAVKSIQFVLLAAALILTGIANLSQSKRISDLEEAVAQREGISRCHCDKSFAEQAVVSPEHTYREGISGVAVSFSRDRVKIITKEIMPSEGGIDVIDAILKKHALEAVENSH